MKRHQEKLRNNLSGNRRSESLFLSFGLLTFVLVLLLGGCVNDEPDEVWSLGPGDALPEFSITDLEGNKIDNHTFYNRRGIIVFFSTTCSDCRREMPVLEAAYRQYLADHNRNDLEVICISREYNISAVREFIKEYDITMPVAVDKGKKVYSKFASIGVPRVYIVDNGIIIDSYLEVIPSTIFERKMLP